jgi:hypothetical protein
MSVSGVPANTLDYSSFKPKCTTLDEIGKVVDMHRQIVERKPFKVFCGKAVFGCDGGRGRSETLVALHLSRRTAQLPESVLEGER